MSRFGVYGVGRSGLAVARAAMARGDQVVAFDDAPLGDRNMRAAQELEAMGADFKPAFRGQLADQGLDVVVTSPSLPMRHPRLTHAVTAGLEVISEVEYAFRVAKAPIVAVTGTNGKSTTAVMTYLALTGAGEDAVLCGNIYGSGFEEIPLTEAAANGGPDSVLVAEISSSQLEWVSGFAPVSAAITNITEDHGDRYRTFDEYASMKNRIFAAQKKTHFAVKRAHDPHVPPPLVPHVLNVGGAEREAEVLETRLRLFDATIEKRNLPFDEPHNYVNAAMALLLAYGYLKWRAGGEQASQASRTLQTEGGFPVALFEGLTRFRGIDNRMERVGEKNGVRVINNSMCTNAQAVLSSCEAAPGPLRLLMGGKLKGDTHEYQALGQYLYKRGANLYLYGEDREELNLALDGGYPCFESLRPAAEAALREASSGDTVMLAPGCASFDEFKDFRHRGDVFKQIAREWLDEA